MSKSALQTITMDIQVKGSGETEDQAVEATFKEMRKVVTKDFQHPIVSIRTVDYIVNNLNKIEKDEAYLFVFMKRTRTTYEVDVTIKVEIDFVDLEGGKVG